LVLLLLLMVVFVAGCDVGSNTTTSNSRSTTTGGTAIPQLGTADIEPVREAVIAKVQPAVVQVNVQTGNGGDVY